MFPKEYVLIAFVAVIVVYFIAKYLTEKAMNSAKDAELQASMKAERKTATKQTAEDCAEGGCGMRSICTGKEKVEYDYFEDEELDNYKGRSADSYTAYEVSEFQDVLETLRGDEVAPWLNSLCARGVALPDQLHQEAIDLVNKNKKG